MLSNLFVGDEMFVLFVSRSEKKRKKLSDGYWIIMRTVLATMYGVL